MTSDKASKPSEARRNLDLILHADKHPISLSDLTPEEFDALLRDTLVNTDLRELRGFKTMKDMMTRTPGSFVIGARQDPTETVKANEDTKVEGPLALTTHLVSVTRGAVSYTQTYRRYESNEETTVHAIAREWGHQAYVWRSDGTSLVLRRPNDHSRADENLFSVRCITQKVPHKDEMAVVSVVTEAIPLSRFREQFKEKYSRIACDVIWELASLSRATLRELESQAENFRRRVAEIDRLASAIHG
jgi:hypothetical protein